MAKKIDPADELLKSSMKEWLISKNSAKKGALKLDSLLELVMKIIKVFLGFSSAKLDSIDGNLGVDIQTWVNAKNGGKKKGMSLITIITLVLQLLEAVFGDLQSSGQLPS